MPFISPSEEIPKDTVFIINDGNNYICYQKEDSLPPEALTTKNMFKIKNGD